MSAPQPDPGERKEADEQYLAGKTIRCQVCGHTVPTIPGWMLPALRHHIAACHDGHLNLLNRR